MSSTSSATAPDVQATQRWIARSLGAAGGRFGLLLVALVALMAAAPLIVTRPMSDAVLAVFTGSVLLAGLHAARSGGKPVAVGLALALADFLVGRLAIHFGTQWLILLETLLWLSTLIYVTATILRTIFTSREVTVETLLAAPMRLPAHRPVLGIRLHLHRPDAPQLIPAVAPLERSLGG